MTITLVIHTSNIFELNNDVQYITSSDSRPYFKMPAALYLFLIMSIPAVVLKWLNTSTIH